MTAILDIWNIWKSALFVTRLLVPLIVGDVRNI